MLQLKNSAKPGGASGGASEWGSCVSTIKTMTAGAVALLLSGCGSFHILPAADEDFASQPSAHIMDRISGHWRRQGDKSCELGPEIVRDHSELTVTAGQQRTVYLIESNGLRKGVVRVIKPEG